MAQCAQCSVDDCTSPARARGWCSLHYARWKRTGDTNGGRPARRYTVDGEAVRGPHPCEFCQTQIVQGSVGRQRIFCSSLCEARHRSRKTSEKVQAARCCWRCGAKARNRTGRPVCDPCNKAAAIVLQRRRTLAPYRLTPDQYDALLAAQGGGCAICHRDTSGAARKAHLLVDHNHGTGAVRGLLCHPCNVILGHARDDPALLMAAARYVKSG